MNAQQCRPGGRFMAGERGAFKKPAAETAVERLGTSGDFLHPHALSFSCPTLVLGGCYAVPMLKFADVFHWGLNRHAAG